VTVPAFDPLRALRTLIDYGVEFVVIGGIAGRLWGSPTVTNDLDICYRCSPMNLERLADALNSIHARLRGVDDEVPFQLDAAALANGDSFTFVTDAGNLDVLGTPSGTTGYDDLLATANEVDLEELKVKVCDLEDLIRMKRAAARPKDLIEVEVLTAVRDETGQNPDEEPRPHIAQRPRSRSFADDKPETAHPPKTSTPSTNDKLTRDRTANRSATPQSVRTDPDPSSSLPRLGAADASNENRRIHRPPPGHRQSQGVLQPGRWRP